ncbi:MAG: hypothetical protein ABIU77_01420, partial [Ferruginibacter sp.]
WVIFVLRSALIAGDIVSTSSMYICQTDNVVLYFKVVKLFCKFIVLSKQTGDFIDRWLNMAYCGDLCYHIRKCTRDGYRVRLACRHADANKDP